MDIEQESDSNQPKDWEMILKNGSLNRKIYFLAKTCIQVKWKTTQTPRSLNQATQASKQPKTQRCVLNPIDIPSNITLDSSPASYWIRLKYG